MPETKESQENTPREKAEVKKMSVDGPREKEQMSVDEDTQKWDKTISV